jgi:F0F1-type ATP synthase assembly protein I
MGKGRFRSLIVVFPMNPSSEPKTPIKPWWQPAVALFLRLSAWIAAPVVMATILGRWLDGRFGTEPWLFISTVGLAFIISMVVLVKTVAEEYKKIEKDSKSKIKKMGN